MQETYAKYTAKQGEFLSGIPARDLSQAEWDALPADLQKEAIEAKVYAIVKKKEGS